MIVPLMIPYGTSRYAARGTLTGPGIEEARVRVHKVTQQEGAHHKDWNHV